MYADFFGLRELPFNNTPDPRFFFSTPDHEEALASLIYAVQERKGFVLLTGEVGAGKTLVSRMMLRHFGATIAFANINHAVHSARDLMESVCAEFELDISAGAGHTQLVRTLHDYLLTRFAQNVPVVLVLDEAQNLPTDAFEQLRMIGNLEADDAKLLQIAIVGQPELQNMFRSPELRQLKQRLFRGFHLPALSRELTEKYIRHRLTVSGGDMAELIAASAVDEAFAVSRGLPRIINTVCDNALLSAYSANRRHIDGPFMRSVLENMLLVGTVVPQTDTKTPVRTGARIATECVPAKPHTFLASPAPRTAACERKSDQDQHRRVTVVPASLPVRRDLDDTIAGQIDRVRSQLRRWRDSCLARDSGDVPTPASTPAVSDFSDICMELRRLRSELISAVQETTDRVASLESRLPQAPHEHRASHCQPHGESGVIAERTVPRSLPGLLPSVDGARQMAAGVPLVRPTAPSVVAEPAVTTRSDNTVQRLAGQAERCRNLMERLKNSPSCQPVTP